MSQMTSVRTVTVPEFLRDTAAVIKRCEEEGPVDITLEDGTVCNRVSIVVAFGNRCVAFETFVASEEATAAWRRYQENLAAEYHASVVREAHDRTQRVLSGEDKCEAGAQAMLQMKSKTTEETATEMDGAADACDTMGRYLDAKGEPHAYPEHAELLRKAATRLREQEAEIARLRAPLLVLGRLRARHLACQERGPEHEGNAASTWLTYQEQIMAVERFAIEEYARHRDERKRDRPRCGGITDKSAHVIDRVLSDDELRELSGGGPLPADAVPIEVSVRCKVVCFGHPRHHSWTLGWPVPMQAKDILDDTVLSVIDQKLERERMWTHVQDLQAAMPNIPRKVLLAKMRSMIRRGIVDGCACGCRGDFERKVSK